MKTLHDNNQLSAGKLAGSESSSRRSAKLLQAASLIALAIAPAAVAEDLPKPKPGDDVAPAAAAQESTQPKRNDGAASSRDQDDHVILDQITVTARRVDEQLPRVCEG